jgi:hypothetical protein
LEEINDKIKGEGRAYLAVIVAGKGGGNGGYVTRIVAVRKVEVAVEPSSWLRKGGWWWWFRNSGNARRHHHLWKNIVVIFKKEGRGHSSLIAVVLVAAWIWPWS